MTTVEFIIFGFVTILFYIVGETMKIKSLSYLLKSWSMILIILMVAAISEKKTAINCIKGHNPYKMKVMYYHGTTIPMDTIYIYSSKKN